MAKLILIPKKVVIILVFMCIFLIIIFFISSLILFTIIEIHIENIKYLSENRNLNKDYRIIVKLKIFNKLTYLKINLKKSRMKNVRKLLKIDKLKENILQNKNSLDNGIFKLSKHVKVKKLNLKINIGVEDAAINAIFVGLISTIVSIVLRNFIENKSEAFWRVMPIYENKNILKINLDAIFKIRLIDILAKKKEQ